MTISKSKVKSLLAQPGDLNRLFNDYDYKLDWQVRACSEFNRVLVKAWDPVLGSYSFKEPVLLTHKTGMCYDFSGRRLGSLLTIMNLLLSGASMSKICWEPSND